ncbi:ricin-type beta-trefoil lectin domain protein [Ceratobasidium sp. AG-Ba]|nr:ricin-type beta-trefoil lectin domain protein [Ceratobasidium sp. AG-Ba]
MSFESPVQISLSGQKILTMMAGDSDSPVYATSANAKPGKQTWSLHKQQDNTYHLQNQLFHKYIGVAASLHPNVTAVATESPIDFVVESTGRETYKLYVKNDSEKLYLYLAPDWSHSPKVALVREQDAKDNWRIESIV